MGIISVILVSLFSLGLFFYFQQLAQAEIKASLLEQQKEQQIETTARMSVHIGSDLNLVINTIEGLANSYYLQQGDLYSENAKSLIEEKYEELNPRINRLIILDRNNIVAASLAPPNTETFLSSDFSLRDWVIQTKQSTKPMFSDGYERQGIYRIFISYPIVNGETQDILGVIAVSIPTVPFFAYYANVHDINSQFLVALSREGTLLAVGASQDLVGKNYFGEETQNFINYNPVLNNLTRSLLDGNSGYAVYDYGRGERITTQSPIYVQGQPLYFIQLVTPTAEIYSKVDSVLQDERTKLFLPLSGTVISIAVLTVFLLKWNGTLGNEVRIRTKQLSDANERLEINLKAQKEFVDIAAHELRTPVQPILGLAEVLQTSAIESSRGGSGASTIAVSRERQLLEVIIRNAQRLKNLTENLLDVTRIDSASLRLSNEKFDLSGVVASTVQDFKNGLDMNVKIDIVFTPCENAIVNADKERVIQVISNLLNNSQKFAKEGTIQVGIKRVDSQVMVTIRDDGEGIHPDVLPMLFTKFVSRSDGGTGLGLYISKGIVEAQGGKIWAENNDEGTG
ncbi:MAG: sensor histidine kinase, partial [Nitrososphaerales archaeon]